jgi:hypothetical protein
MMKVAHRDHEHVLPPSHRSDPDPDVGRLKVPEGSRCPSKSTVNIATDSAP